MAPANDFFLVAQTLAEEVGTLRTRVAELEAALESVCVALLPHDSRCQNVNAVFEAHDRARAALGAKGE